MIPILERKAALRKITQRFVDYRILLMHGVVVSNGIDSIMFTAQSGEGKTTRAHLLIDSVPGTYILNGDKPLIKCGDNNIVLAHGSPWKGKENEGINGKAKLKGIFLLERSDRTEIEELTMAKSFSFLMNQTFMPSDSENIMKTMTLLHSLEGKVKLYRFKSTPTANSVQEAWKIALL